MRNGLPVEKSRVGVVWDEIHPWQRRSGRDDSNALPIRKWFEDLTLFTSGNLQMVYADNTLLEEPDFRGT